MKNVAITTIALVLAVAGVANSAPPTFTISGFVQTGAGSGVGGVDVVGDNEAGSAVTGADGSYTITVPNHWDGTVTVSKTGWLITPASKTYSNVMADKTNENYTAYQPKISGVVTKSDSTPLAEATVAADNGGGSGTTDAAGYYEIFVPYNWSGAVSSILTGYHFTDNGYTNVITDQTNQDFTGFQPTISGSTGLAGATITFSGIGSVVSTPAYSVIVPYGWSGTVEVSLAGYNFTESPRTYTNVTANESGQDFTPYQPTISGTTNIAGATVTVSGVGTVTSTPNYTITVPYGWSGTIAASLSGYNFSESPRTYTNVTANETGQDFTPYQPTISGLVRKADGTALAGATVTADNGSGSDTTDANGYYEIVLPYGWSGNVAAERFNLLFTPESYSYSNLTVDQSNQNFDIAYAGIITVKSDGTGDVPTIQTAIDIAIDGDVVQVEDGTYTGDGNRDIDFIGKGITVRGNVEDPNMVIIDCQGSKFESHRGFKFISGEDANSILEGFTITNGYMFLLYGTTYGGAINIDSSSPSIKKCIITNSYAEYGGGICCDGTNNPAIENCMISGNSAAAGGGIHRCAGTITNCTLSGNSAYLYGGGFNWCNGTINNCTLTGNSAKYGGGLIS